MDWQRWQLRRVRGEEIWIWQTSGDIHHHSNRHRSVLVITVIHLSIGCVNPMLNIASSWSFQVFLSLANLAHVVPMEVWSLLRSSFFVSLLLVVIPAFRQSDHLLSFPLPIATWPAHLRLDLENKGIAFKARLVCTAWYKHGRDHYLSGMTRA